MIFPEGFTSKQGYIKPFKYGAFSALAAIEPIYMAVNSNYYETCYYYNDLLTDLIYSLSQPYITMEVVHLPCIEPIEGCEVNAYLTQVREMYSSEFHLSCIDSFDIFQRDLFLKKIHKQDESKL